MSGRSPLAWSTYSLLGKETLLFQRCGLLLQLPKGAHKIGMLWWCQSAYKRWKRASGSPGKRVVSLSSCQARKNGAVIIPLISCLTLLEEMSVVLEWMRMPYGGTSHISSLAPGRQPAHSHADSSPSTTLDVICNTYSFRSYSSTGGWGSKESACNAGDLGTIPMSGRSPGEGNGNPLQYSCLENPMDRGAWQDTVHGVAEADTTECLTITILTVSV